MFIFDIFKGGSLMFLGLSPDKPGLKAVLENKKILKILHDCRNDWDSLLYQYSVRLFGFIDTQEAYFVYILFYKQEITLPISLLNFIKIFSGDDLVKKSQMKTKMHSDHAIWGIRPIEEDMLIYASEDVKFLVKAWNNLKEKLNEYLIEIIKVLSILKVVDFEMFSEFAEYLTKIFFDNYQLVVKEQISFQVLVLMDYVYGFFEMKSNEETNKEETENNIVRSGFDYKKKQRMSCLNDMMKQYESNRKIIYNNNKNNKGDGFNKGNSNNISKNYVKKNNKKNNANNSQNNINKANNESCITKVNEFNNTNQFYQKNTDSNKNKEKKEVNTEKEKERQNNKNNNKQQNNTQKKVKGNSLSKEKPKITNTTNDNQKSKSKQKQQPTYIPKKTYNTYTHPVHPFSELFYDDTDKFYYNNNMLHYNNNHYAKKRTNQYTPIKRNPLQNNIQNKNYNTYYNNYNNNGYTNNYNNNYAYYNNYYTNQNKQKWKKYNNIKNYKMNNTNQNQKNRKYIYYVYSIKTSSPNNEPKLKASKSFSSLEHIEQIEETKRHRSFSKENIKQTHTLFDSE